MARTLNTTAIVREHLRRVAMVRFEPMIAASVRQGTAEGSLNATSPEHAAGILGLPQGSFRMIDEPSKRFWFA